MLLSRLKKEYLDILEARAEEYPALTEAIRQALIENRYYVDLKYNDMSMMVTLFKIDRMDLIFNLFD